MRSEVIPSLPDVQFRGPPLTEGPLPAALYLALSARESLDLEPINAPVSHLPLDRVRAFSVTLPGHGRGFDNSKAMAYWVEQLSKNPSFFEDFLVPTCSLCQKLVDLGWVTPGKFLVSGLSRGGFVAFHLLARCKELSGLCSFAPVTNVNELGEFHKIPTAENYSVHHLANKLIGKPIFISIGNHDTRVGSRSATNLALDLVEANTVAGNRSPQVELRLFPSVGHKGHGTPPERFISGAHWMKKQLLES